MKFNQNMSEVKEMTPGDYERPPAGGYVLKCLSIEDKLSKNGKPMLTLTFDIAEGPFAGKFEKYPLRYYQTYGDSDSNPRMKGLLNAFLQSNGGFLRVQDIETVSFDERRLVGLKVGAVLQEEEYLNKYNRAKLALKIFFLCSIKRIEEHNFTTPPTKTLGGPDIPEYPDTEVDF